MIYLAYLLGRTDLPRESAMGKMRAMVEGARLVRSELQAGAAGGA